MAEVMPHLATPEEIAICYGASRTACATCLGSCLQRGCAFLLTHMYSPRDHRATLSVLLPASLCSQFPLQDHAKEAVVHDGLGWRVAEGALAKLYVTVRVR